MKIMHLLFSFTVGGTEKLVTDICNEMVRQGQDVFLYIVNRYYSEDMLKGLRTDVTVELQNRNPSEESIVKTMQKIERYVKRNHIEVVHCNSFNSPELLILTKVLHPSVRIAYTIHGMNQWRNLSGIRSTYRNIVCSCIIAISEAVRKDIIASGAKVSKVSVVYNAIDLEKFKNQKKTKAIGSAIRIGNVARIMPGVKGQDILIKAFAMVRTHFPEISCVFAGGADAAHQEEFEELKTLAKSFGLEEYVEFVGSITDVPGFLKNIDLFILPSRSEGFGLSLVEAMVMGIPCIASDLNGPAEIIGSEERGLLFLSEDVEALAEKIIYAIEHKGEMEKIAKTAETYVAEQFDIRNMCKQLVRLYKK